MAVNNLNTPGVGIQPSIVDAKGDLIAGTAADAVGRLAVGTNGQQLVADSTASTGLKWDNPSGLVHINTTTFTGVASQSFNDVFTSTYNNYKIYLYFTPSTNADKTVDLRFRTSGTDNTSSLYAWASTGINANDTGANTSSSGSSSLRVHTNTYFNSVSFYSVLDITSPNLAITTGVNGQSSGFTSSLFRGNNVIGIFNGNTVFDGFSLLISGGNFTNAQISIYGYRK
jgi:hypothetical protein